MQINNIIPFSIVDGPGNRMVIFLQECNLNCLYCHNFETINKCNNCLKCINVCPTKSLTNINGKVSWNEETCINCDKCIYECEFSSTPKTKDHTPKEVASMIIKYKDFIDGVTFSGGECMLQADDILSVVKILKLHDINVLIDSNGYFDVSANEELIKLVDGFMIDIKSLNKNYLLTGVDYSNLETIDYLNKLNKLHELRTVDLLDSESKKVIQYIESFIEKNPSVKKRINKLSTQNLKQSRLDKLNNYLKL
ncbi:YjjW family glycine radical enzyme activase [Mycoplasma sp. P36-A1]|uniref:YjjW family glycine radical enzyme activase n=1 Tax=Mycoplasma sp. P36-A1 TaxID=3252900 RepID=UPI003C2D8F3F